MINKVAFVLLLTGLTAFTQNAQAGRRADDGTTRSLTRHAFRASRSITPNSLTPAGDNAGNAPYTPTHWQTGDNGGSGFGAWTLTSAGGGGSFIGASGQGPTPTFGLFGAAAGSSSADRPFTGALTTGQTFSIDLGNTASVATGQTLGLNLTSNGVVEFTLKFTGGGTTWQINDGGSDFGIAQNFASNTSLHFTFTYNGGNNYSYTFGSASGTGFTATNPLTNINGVRLFDGAQGAGENFGFNNLAIVPEPATVLLVGPALLGGMFFIRRRRA